jgi:hypothetical protein
VKTFVRRARIIYVKKKVFAVTAVNWADRCSLAARENAGASGASLASLHLAMSAETFTRLALELAAETDHGLDRLYPEPG